MLIGLIDTIKGNYTIRAEGRFPERILNIASTGGIYIRNVVYDSPTSITFCLSRKGAHKLLSGEFEGLKLSVTEKSGLPVFLRRHKKRFALIMLPFLFAFVTGILSLFVWRVEITGGDKMLQAQVEKVIRENGVYMGALKSGIDRYDVKRKAILEINDLSWLWVDIKGTTANVKIQKRTKTPKTFKIDEPADVISMHTGVIEKMQVYCGIPLFKEGMTVEKGQIIVTGVLRSENENIPTYYHHAAADITLRINEQKTVVIPHKTIRKAPTGRKKNIFSVNFKKNKINFSLNSGISYTNYDRIDKTVKIPFLPISFSKTTYLEANVIEETTDTEALLNNYRNDFEKELQDKGADIIHIKETSENTATGVKVTFNAECLIRADKEIPIDITKTEDPIYKGE